MTSKFHSGLLKDLSLILNYSDDYNVIIQVEVHSSTGWITKKDDMIMFNKPNINPTVFEMILKYIYTGELDLTMQSGGDILGLLAATDELLIEELFNHAQDYLIEKKTNWVQRNIILVLYTVFKLDSCKKLRDYCHESICADPQPLITSKHFPLLNKHILYDLLKRDDLQIEETVAWDCLIKWGIEQTPGLGNDRNNWTNKDFEALKETLSSFIPLIRFVELSPADYYDKVRPYKAIIPDHIYKEVEEFYFKGNLPKTTTLPPRTGMVQKNNSRIIKPKLLDIIANWIHRKNANAARNRYGLLYNFNLFYRKSRDGNINVRNICTGKGATLILFQVKDSGKIFGGYNPIGWVDQATNRTNNYRPRYPRISCRYLSTTKSFIFSFKNNNDTESMAISRVIEPSCAICDDFKSINFGKGELRLDKQNNNYIYLSNEGLYYDILNHNTEDSYEIEEIEAFSVVKK